MTPGPGLEAALAQALPQPPRPELLSRAFPLRPGRPLPVPLPGAGAARAAERPRFPAGPGRLSGRCLRRRAGLARAARGSLCTALAAGAGALRRSCRPSGSRRFPPLPLRLPQPLPAAVPTLPAFRQAPRALPAPGGLWPCLPAACPPKALSALRTSGEEKKDSERLMSLQKGRERSRPGHGPGHNRGNLEIFITFITHKIRAG